MVQVKSISMEEIISHRSEILRLAHKYGVSKIRVFGSVARGTANENSDIDFVVDIEPGRSLFDLGALMMDLADLFGRDVDIVTTHGIRSNLRAKVLAEAVAV